MQAYVCLGCLIVTMNSDVNDYVRCPVCYSYCAGTVEHYHTKAVLPMGVTKALRIGMELTDNIKKALASLDDPINWRTRTAKICDASQGKIN